MASVKCKKLPLIALVMFDFLGLGSQAQAPGPEIQNHKSRHHTYKLIDLGTFGGLNGGVPVEGTGGPYINASGALIGQANTTVLIPPEYVGFVCFPGPTANHAFKWQRGRLIDLGALWPSE